MRDFVLFLLFVAVVAAPAYGATVVLSRRYPYISRSKLLSLAPLPLPGLLVAMSVIMIFDAYFSTDEECGVDACAMALVGAVFVTAAAIIAYAVGVAAAAFAYRSRFFNRGERGRKL
ncbi:hypothetical protein ACFQPG_08880 [Sphingomonas sp. GCM10030256]|uniref:hypothetical protein n=1 Tax=Sphingomonas sp. GCM10030256 TaxID=3273427 RepID=UPI00360EF254